MKTVAGVSVATHVSAVREQPGGHRVDELAISKDDPEQWQASEEVQEVDNLHAPVCTGRGSPWFGRARERCR